MELKLKDSPFLAGAFGAAILANLIGMFALLFSFKALPSEVPLLFTSGEALTNKIFLFAVPILSFLFLIGNALAAEAFLRRREPSAAVFPTFLTLFVSTILSSSLIRILHIFPLPLLPLEETLYPLLLPFGTAAILGFLLTALFAWVARKGHFFDQPHGPYPQVRKIPRLGAPSLFLTFAVLAIIFTPLSKALVAFLIGGAVITLIQTIDDLFPLPAWIQGAGHLLAGLIIVGGGIGVNFIGNPLSAWIGEAYLRLDTWKIPFSLGGITYHVTVLADLFTIAWIFALVNVVDWLDGLDGLAVGIGTITTLTIIAISLIFKTPITALLGVILAGALIGFLPLNFFPAKIYLGGGAFLLGYFLAVLSIFSGAKAGTAILVLTIPIIDAFFVIYRRIRSGQSPFIGDKTHLHHRLLKAGMNHPHIVLLEWGIVAALAVAAVMLKGFLKFAAVGLVIIGALFANRWLLRRLGSKARKTSKSPPRNEPSPAT